MLHNKFITTALSPSPGNCMCVCVCACVHTCMCVQEGGRVDRRLPNIKKANPMCPQGQSFFGHNQESSFVEA